MMTRRCGRLGAAALLPLLGGAALTILQPLSAHAAGPADACDPQAPRHGGAPRAGGGRPCDAAASGQRVPDLDLGGDGGEDGGVGGIALHLLSRRAAAQRSSSVQAPLQATTTVAAAASHAMPDVVGGGSTTATTAAAATAQLLPVQRAPVVLLEVGLVAGLASLMCCGPQQARGPQRRPPSPPRYVVQPFWQREVVSELLGTLVVTLVCNMVSWTSAFVNKFELQEEDAAAGVVSAPAFPQSPLFIAICVGLAYVLAMNMAPGATLNPLFCVMLAYFGIRSWSLAAACCAAQLVGMLIAHGLTYAMLASSLRHFLGKSGMAYKTMETAALFGVQVPPEWVPNEVALLATVVCSATLVMLLFPIVSIRLKGVPDLHPFAERLAISLVIVAVTGAFGLSGLGSPPHPFAMLSGAVFLSEAGWPMAMWTAHGHYIWISVVGPVLGLAIGLVLAQLVLCLAFEEVRADQEHPHAEFSHVFRHMYGDPDAMYSSEEHG